MQAAQHEIRLLERPGGFLQAVCSCGWLGAARSSRVLARQEARDHALLYAGTVLDGDTAALLGDIESGHG